MANVNDALWSESRGELIDRIRELEGSGTAGVLIGRLRAELAEARALIDDQAERLENLPTVTLETACDSPELEALRAAAQSVAERISTNDDLHPDELATLAGAASSLAVAHREFRPRPLPALGR